MFLQNAVADALNNTEWAFPLAECFHIVGFAVSIGSVAVLDLRLLGLGLRHEKPAQLVKYTEPWTLIALVFVIFSGAALFVSQSDIYLANKVFPWKMVLLVVAILYNFTVHRKVAMSAGPSTPLTKVVALLSLALWVGIVFGGIFIAFV